MTFNPFRSVSLAVLLPLLFAAPSLSAAEPRPDQFRQLDDVWPTPNEIRRPSGSPGKDYWQQKVDYEIAVEIDDARQIITGSETITYHNNSPDELDVLWLQLDQNRYERDSDDRLSTTAPNLKGMSYGQLRSILYRQQFDGGFKISNLRDANGKKLEHSINGTMLRVHLPKVLKPGKQTTFSLDWWFRIPDGKAIYVRGGFEFFEKDGNYLYTIAQWYPRLCAYTDYGGWQNRQTLGAEFALEFGDFDVAITVPNDHIVGATGELQNPEEVLTETQRNRLKEAATAEKPVYIVTEEEALANESSKPTGTKTWKFSAKNVRDFSFASSRKFLWDAQGIDLNGRRIMAMSLWPKEGQPLWGQYSTASVIHAVRTYSKFTFDYPYPVIYSINSPVGGMEYPMVTFQSARPEEDGTYSLNTKVRLIAVIIHEVGHNWFPMVVNSDERQWRWMDEGLNSFVQFLAEQEWEEAFPSRVFQPNRKRQLMTYLRRGDVRPIMSAADNLIEGGHNAYGKPALALMILRESVLGREQFDYAFKQYARRWMFKRPTPYDFFRAMEECTGRDLDWFWRGWFYTTDHVDVSIESVRKFRLDTRNPDVEKKRARDERDMAEPPLTVLRNKPLPKRVDQSEDLKDFYSTYDELAVEPKEREAYQKMMKDLKPYERDLLQTKGNFYVIELKNLGGLVMPLVLKIKHTDDTERTMRLPAEVWRLNGGTIRKLIMTQKEVASITLDPQDEMGDVDRKNNRFPRLPEEDSFQLQKSKKSENPMQRLKKAEGESKKEETAEEKGEKN